MDGLALGPLHTRITQKHSSRSCVFPCCAIWQPIYLNTFENAPQITWNHCTMQSGACKRIGVLLTTADHKGRTWQNKVQEIHLSGNVFRRQPALTRVSPASEFCNSICESLFNGCWSKEPAHKVVKWCNHLTTGMPHTTFLKIPFQWLHLIVCSQCLVQQSSARLLWFFQMKDVGQEDGEGHPQSEFWPGSLGTTGNLHSVWWALITKVNHTYLLSSGAQFWKLTASILSILVSYSVQGCSTW